jgi:hypothetical protein
VIIMSKVVILLLAAALMFLVVQKPSAQESYETAPVPVDRDVISLIIGAVQEKQPGWVPIDTVYVNPVVNEQGASLFNSRFMFYDKYKYSGSQIDVQCSVEGSKASIVSMTPVSEPDPTSALMAYKKGPTYQDYNDIRGNFDQQLNDYLAMSKRPAGFQTPF